MRYTFVLSSLLLLLVLVVGCSSKAPEEGTKSAAEQKGSAIAVAAGESDDGSKKAGMVNNGSAIAAGAAKDAPEEGAKEADEDDQAADREDEDREDEDAEDSDDDGVAEAEEEEVEEEAEEEAPRKDIASVDAEGYVECKDDDCEEKCSCKCLYYKDTDLVLARKYDKRKDGSYELTRTYHYNAKGHLVRWVDDGRLSSYESKEAVLGDDEPDRVTVFTYDDEGNRLNRESWNRGGRTNSFCEYKSGCPPPHAFEECVIGKNYKCKNIPARTPEGDAVVPLSQISL